MRPVTSVGRPAGLFAGRVGSTVVAAVGGWCAAAAAAVLLVAAVVVVLVVGAVSASAVVSCGGCEPWWHLDAGSRPSVLAAGGEGEVVLDAENVGDAGTAGGGIDPVRIVDRLPVGLRAVGIAGSATASGAPGETGALSCSLEELACETGKSLIPYGTIEVRITVQVAPGAVAGETNTVSVSGGGAPAAQLSRPVTLAGTGAGAGGGVGGGFGLEGFQLAAEGEGGVPFTRAGGHPFQVTGSIAFDQGPDTGSLTGAPQVAPAGAVRDVVGRLPVGLVADVLPLARCGLEGFQRSFAAEGQPSAIEDECTASAAVGVASVSASRPGVGVQTYAVPIFNVEPGVGEPARFGFIVPYTHAPVLLETSVRSGQGEDWGVNLTATEIPQDAGLLSVRLTFWGAPGRGSHNSARGWGCLAQTRGAHAFEGCVANPEEPDPPAFLTMPITCTGPLAATLEADSWTAAGVFSRAGSESLAGVEGCGSLPFTPGIETIPTTRSASSPSGLAFDLDFDGEGLTNANGVAQSDLKETVVGLPEGMTIDPSAGVGLGACTQAQYQAMTLDSPAGVGCPEDSRLGTVEIQTPLLLSTVYGSLYLAQPYENPFGEPGSPGGSLLALYVVARSRAERGVIVKMAGRVSANPTTGRLTIGFAEDPQVPFERFNFHFREGAQAPLITPSTCGTYTTQAQLTPWSEPLAVLQDTATFQITTGAEGGACPTGGLPPFVPRIQAATVTGHAGSYSPFYVELSRTDAMSAIASYTASLPEGLSANLSGIPFCPQAGIEAARTQSGIAEEQEPSCPAGSLIGHTLVGTGVGSVLDYVPGRLYLAGPFHGDPFSVASITSAVIGPFDLGTVVIRFGLAIDPNTARVSIDPAASETIPTIIKGIVTHVRDIRVSIDRPNFTLNPTNCQPKPVTSTLTSSNDQTANATTLFQVEECPELHFKPHFTAQTRGHTSRTEGASLTVKLTQPSTPGQDANIHSVKVILPHQLPARLPTLQQACTQTQFQSNPAACPTASTIGHATATTPLLPNPLTGPAIFVSHGGQEFPSLDIVLQGDGVTIDLAGETYITKNLTSTTFTTIPDAPVQSFALTLPEGPHSALSALGDLCKLARAPTTGSKAEHGRRTGRGHGRHTGHGHHTGTPAHIAKHTQPTKPTGLRMPTEFVAQNGLVFKQDTTIAVTGCSAAQKDARRRRRPRRRR